MHRLTVERVFSAAHAIAIGGVREPLHGHDWRARVTIEGDSLDADGLLMDFHELERILEGIIAPFRNANLNDIPPFDATNPTAERVAEHVGRAMMKALPAHLRLSRAQVTEAPGCVAAFDPGSN